MSSSPFISIEDLLKKLGASPSSKIKKELLKLGYSDDAAKKRISRTKNTIKRFTAIKLPRRESFLYLESQYGSEHFWQALIDAHIEANSAYGIAIQSIVARGGTIPKNFFDVLSGSPQELKKHISSNNLLQHLLNSKLLKLTYDPTLGQCIVLDAQGKLDHLLKGNPNSLKAEFIIEEIIVDGVLNWLRKIGLASYHAIQKRALDTTPDFAHFKWDITAPCYIPPIANLYKKDSPSFITVDVTNHNIDKGGAKYFIKKCTTIRAMKKISPFLPIFIANHFTEDAFQLGKDNNIIFTTPKIIFGNEVAESLKDLFQTLEHAAAILNEKPEKIDRLFKSLGNIAGRDNNLQGALFELITGYFIYHSGLGDQVKFGVEVKNPKNSETAEIDVLSTIGEHEVAIYECKGYINSKVSKEDINKWLTRSIPTIKSYLKYADHYKNRNISFHYWTTSDFTEEATLALNNAKENTKKYKIEYKNGKDILDYAKGVQLTSMVDILNQHYFKHPLSKI